MKPFLQLFILMLVAASFIPSATAQTAGAVYPGSNFGPIPDGLSSGPLAYGAPRDIGFEVQNRTGSINTVRVRFRANHSYVGDLKVQLIAPDGRSHLLFERTGATSSTSRGYGSNLIASVAYEFGDDFGPIVGTNWWTAANVGPGGDIGSDLLFSTVISGGPEASVPATTTSMTETLRTAQPNGTWILRFEDGWSGAAGEVTDAELVITDTGTTHVVTNSLDPTNPVGTLRGALTNATAGDLITFSEDLYSNGPTFILINRNLPSIPDGVAIIGPGSSRLAIRRLAATQFRVFTLIQGQATIQGLRITGGNTGDSFGGGIYNGAGNLTLIDVDLFQNNASDGAGLLSTGRLTMIRCAVRENESANIGGGLSIILLQDVKIYHTTVFANSASQQGGGIFIRDGNGSEMALSNSTIAANSSSANPGIRTLNLQNSVLRLTSNLIAGQAPNIVAGGTGAAIVSGGFNLASDDGSGFLGQSSDQINSDPGALVLDDSSGLTPVLRLPVDSPALDAGISNDGSFFDGRGEGFARTVDLDQTNAGGSDGTDVGAFELRGPIVFRSRFESN